jgi:hypothetical protein|tara:strand:- start:654 stop:926 length:273 start_codon:yes stop_codon:yes gene_type:complete
MHSINTENELIFSIKEKDHNSFKSFLESLNLKDGNEEVCEFWFSEGAWNVETDDGINFIVIFGKSQIHLLIRKDSHFEDMKAKFLSFVSF